MPETAPALVRALQTASNQWDFRIPDEEDELQIDAPPYSLVGWLAHIGGDAGFDEHDPFRYEVGQTRVKRGRKPAEAFVQKGERSSLGNLLEKSRARKKGEKEHFWPLDLFGRLDFAVSKSVIRGKGVAEQNGYVLRGG